MQEIIKSEMVKAMKSKDKDRLSIIRLINGKVTEFLKENPEASDDRLISVLDAMVKERNKTIEIYLKADESEKADRESYEISVITEFLPKRMSIDELSVVVKTVIEKTEATSMRDMGKVMGMVKQTTQGAANPSDIASVVKELLS